MSDTYSILRDPGRGPWCVWLLHITMHGMSTKSHSKNSLGHKDRRKKPRACLWLWVSQYFVPFRGDKTYLLRVIPLIATLFSLSIINPGPSSPHGTGLWQWGSVTLISGWDGDVNCHDTAKVLTNLMSYFVVIMQPYRRSRNPSTPHTWIHPSCKRNTKFTASSMNRPGPET